MVFKTRKLWWWLPAWAAVLLAGFQPAAAQDSWQAVADERTAVADEAASEQDNPDWDQYAFTLESLSGDSDVSFVDLARQHQPFILFFWLVDCPLCHLQLPQVQELQDTIDRYDLGVRIVAINVDQSGEEAAKFYEDQGMTFDLLHDPRVRYTNEAYHVSDLGCPLTYVFNSDGELVDYLTGYRAQFKKTILQMLDISLPDESRTE